MAERGRQSPAAFRRAVARGHGWFGTGSSPDVHLEGLERAAAQVDRLTLYPLALESPDDAAKFLERHASLAA